MSRAFLTCPRARATASGTRWRSGIMPSQFPEHDVAVDQWFRARGRSITDTNVDFDRDVFAWRSESESPTLTLRITQRVLEDTPATQLGSVLDSLRVADALEAKPKAYTVVMQDQGRPIVRQLDDPPRRGD